MSRLEVAAGDSIVVRETFTGNRLYFHTVIRVTQTQAVCGKYIRFNLETGKLIGSGGGGWNSTSYGRKATDDDFVNEANRKRICYASKQLMYFTVTEENIDTVESLLKTAQAKELKP